MRLFMSEQLPEFDRTFKDALAQEILKSQQRPFTVSIMGQTGVGKTSLLKALFNKAIFNESNENVIKKMRIEHVNFGQIFVQIGATKRFIDELVKEARMTYPESRLYCQ